MHKIKTRHIARAAAVAVAVASFSTEAFAQRASENAVTSADDAFGSTVGNERTGIYSDSDIRGFSPVKAGNLRIEGIYFDQQASLTSRVRAGSTIRVGVAALDYPFPAPTGIVDYKLRPAGEALIVSTAATRTAYGGLIGEIDAQIPVIPHRLSLAGGYGYAHDEYVDGARQVINAVGLTPHIRFEGGEVTPFVSYFETRQISSRIVVTAAGAYLPPLPPERRYLGQDWAEGENDSANYGVLGRARLSDAWAVRGGVIQSALTKHKSFSEIFVVSAADGTATHRVIADPEQVTRSTSGEAQVAWSDDGGAFRHRVIFAVRGRDKLAESGGSDVRDLGPVMLGAYDPEPEPGFAFRPVDESRVRQVTAGLGYIGAVEGWGSVNIGVQKTDYEASFERAGVKTTNADSPWLYNATVVANPTAWLSLYGGYVRGLEESGVAPENAANRNEQLPAVRTTQLDGGVKLRLGPARLVLSGFEITKPYFSFDAANRFTEQGEVRHRGVEASLAGEFAGRLNILAGAVLMDPEVTGEARDLGRVGPWAVGTTKTLVRLDLDYRTDVEGLSFSAAVVHAGERAASARPYAELGGEQLTIPAMTTVDLGARYRFKVRETPMSARLVVANVFDEDGWRIVAANSYQAADTRRVSLFLVADF